MSNYLTDIDPIGESNIKAENKNENKEHDIICNTGNHIERMKNQVTILNGMIEDYKTYTNNALFINNLKHLKQRMFNEINAIEKNFNAYVDLK